MKRLVNKGFSIFQHAGLLILVALLVCGCVDESSQASVDELASNMSQHIEAITLAEAEEGVIPRFNQAKSIACLKAEFRVHDGLPVDLQQGIFSKPASYPAMLRFANATQQDDSKKDIRGVSIKLSNIKGAALWGESGYQDFILNSYPALFVATPEEFLAFIRARLEDKKLRFFLNPFDSHLKSLWIVLKARDKHLSPLDIRYWSTVPFRLGTADASAGQAVKYSLIPCSDYQTTRAVDAGRNQLRAAIKSHLQQAPACFSFAVQKQADPVSMPIEDSSVIWDEEVAPFQVVATITIENQQFDPPQALASCELSSFNPWQSLAAHEPLGRMNAVRRPVYASAAKLRNKE